MQRLLLVLFIILSLFLAFWQEEHKLFLCRFGHGKVCLSEAAHADEVFANLRLSRNFASFFAGNRQQLNLLAAQGSELLHRSLPISFARILGQSHYSDVAISTEEWGLTVLHLPRSDG
ncbi:MAG: hypothetical protein EOM80_14370 [Erysipelotrichia bacterium]|nr:hypothetical protein [Erysipelotrichia bacterium]